MRPERKLPKKEKKVAAYREHLQKIIKTLEE